MRRQFDNSCVQLTSFQFESLHDIWERLLSTREMMWCGPSKGTILQKTRRELSEQSYKTLTESRIRYYAPLCFSHNEISNIFRFIAEKETPLNQLASDVANAIVDSLVGWLSPRSWSTSWCFTLYYLNLRDKWTWRKERGKVQTFFCWT